MTKRFRSALALAGLCLTTLGVVSSQAQEKEKEKKVVTTASGLQYEILKEGAGAAAKAGDQVEVHYTGTLKSNGKKFDSSVDRNKPFSFKLGAGMVIKGWDEGVAGMKLGEKRKLIIPFALAYGEDGRPPVIPAGHQQQ